MEKHVMISLDFVLDTAALGEGGGGFDTCINVIFISTAVSRHCNDEYIA